MSSIDPFDLPAGFPWDQADDEADDVTDTDLNDIVNALIKLRQPYRINQVTHNTAGLCTVNLVSGWHVRVDASAEITGWDITGLPEPMPGAVVDIRVTNVTVDAVLPVDIATGFRVPAGQSAPSLSPLNPGAVVSLFLDAGTGSWVTDGPFLRSAVLDVAGTDPVVAGSVSWADAWSTGWTTGQTGTVQTFPPSDRAGKTGVLIISATQGQTAQSYTGWVGAYPDGTSQRIAGNWGSLEVLKRDLDGTSTDAPDLSGGAIRSVAYLIVEGASAANLSMVAEPVTYGAAQAFPVASASPVVDGAVILAVMMGLYAGFTWAKPANMVHGVNTDPTGTSRPIVVGHYAQATAALFDPDDFLVTAGGTPGGAMTLTLIATPTA